MLKFTAFHPETRISVVERNSVLDIVSLLLNGKADFALTYRPENLQPQLECVPLFDALFALSCIATIRLRGSMRCRSMCSPITQW